MHNTFFHRCFGFFSHMKSRKVLEILAGDIAKKSLTNLVQMVNQRCRLLSTAEVCGFIRAYAGCFNSTIEKNILAENLSQSQAGFVFSSAKEKLIDSAVKEVTALYASASEELAAVA
jgi:hypothetical protein